MGSLKNVKGGCDRTWFVDVMCVCAREAHVQIVGGGWLARAIVEPAHGACPLGPTNIARF